MQEQYLCVSCDPLSFRYPFVSSIEWEDSTSHSSLVLLDHFVSFSYTLYTHKVIRVKRQIPLLITLLPFSLSLHFAQGSGETREKRNKEKESNEPR